MKLKNQTKFRLKGLCLGFLSMAFAIHADAQSAETSVIQKSTDAAALPTASEAQAPDEKQKLDEVIVVGYGTMKKKDVTGSISSVGAKDFNNGIMNSPDQLIQGKASGVQITSNSGAPGASSLFLIRGNSNVRAGNGPLFVVDGIILDGRSAKPGIGGTTDIGGETESSNPLLFLNPADISNIEILKDASATAIYGSRGANGVVLITTKKGSRGDVKVNFTASLAVSNLARKFEVMTGDQYRDIINNYSGAGKYFPDNSGSSKANNGVSTDAVGAILRTGITQNYSLSVSGGSEMSNFRTSLSYSNQQGIVKKTGLEKINLGTNASFNFFNSKKVGMDVNILATQTNDQTAGITDKAGYKGSLIGMALQWNPTRSLYNADGSLSIDKGGSEINPVGFSDAYDDYTKTNTIIASIAPYVDIMQGLRYKVQVSGTLSQANRNNSIANTINIQGVQKVEGNKGGFVAVANSELQTSQITHTLNYNKELNSDLSLNALLGYEYYQTKNRGTLLTGQGFDNFGIPYYEMLKFSTAGTRQISSYNDPTIELQSYFARVVLSYQGKYMFSGTMRADGSSKFGANNKYGYFPSVSAAWVLTNEDFLKNSSTIDLLKLRAGWGLTGNQEFPAGAAQNRYGATGPGSIGQVAVANPDLKWQTDQQINIGLDFALLKNKISGSIEFWNKSTKDLLISQASDAVASGRFVYKNLNANIVNTGMDFSINSLLVNNSDFTWTLGLTSTILMNNSISGIPLDKDGKEVTISTGELNGQGLSAKYIQRIANGQPLNSFFIGDAYVGSPLTKFSLGINTRASYKALSLNLSFNGAFGQKVYNNSANILGISNIGSRNIAATWVGKNSEDPSASPSASISYLEDGSYLRISNATLSYDLSKQLNNKYIKGLVLNVTAQNLYVFTKFTGFDPEVNTNKSVNDVPSQGIEFLPYPNARTFVFGVNVNF